MTMYLIGFTISVILASIGVMYYHTVLCPTPDRYSKVTMHLLISIFVCGAGTGSLFAYNQSVTNSLVEAKLAENTKAIAKLDAEIKEMESNRYTVDNKFNERDYRYTYDGKIRDKQRLLDELNDVKGGRYVIRDGKLYVSTLIPVTRN